MERFNSDLNLLGFGGLRSHLANELRDLQDALFDFAQSEYSRAKSAKTFRRLAQLGVKHLESLQHHLQSLGYYMPSAGGPSGGDFLALRNLWIAYCTTDSEIYLQAR